LVVVIHHFWLTWPDWANALSQPTLRARKFDLLYPLHNGHEAVMFFFILSGLVLALPYLQGRSQPYLRYIGQRFARIYGPYLVALLLCVALAARFHGHTGTEIWSQNFWTEPFTLRPVLDHVLFLGPYDTFRFNYVIWSLVYEMRISIIFPMLAVVVLALRLRASILLALGMAAVALATAVYFPPSSDIFNLMMIFRYMPFFMGGILLAKYLQPLSDWYATQSRSGKFTLTVASFLCYNFGFRIVSDAPLPMFAGEWITGVGAAGFILLGRISYSLYLIHAPVLRLLTIALGDRVSPWLQLPIYLACAVFAGYCFCRAVEEPFMRLGRLFKVSRAQAVVFDHQPV
jgi:peptidoglycan/LPS O-acetylase OafA/YrhL